jgi:glutamate racemase
MPNNFKATKAATQREAVERIVWRKIQMVARIKVKHPCNQLLLDCNSIADAAIDDLRAVIDRHAGDEEAA